MSWIVHFLGGAPMDIFELGLSLIIVFVAKLINALVPYPVTWVVYDQVPKDAHFLMTQWGLTVPQAWTWIKTIEGVMTSLALTFLVAGVLWSGYRVLGAAFNPRSRVHVTEELQRWVLAVLLIVAAPLIWHESLSLNQALVHSFWTVIVGKTGQTVANVGGWLQPAQSHGQAPATSALLAQVMIYAAYQVFQIVIDFMFFARAALLLVLYPLAPLFGGLWLIFPNGQRVVAAYWREVLLNIFMQATAAFFLGIFFNVATVIHGVVQGGLASAFLILVFFMVFVPFINILRAFFGAGPTAAGAIGMAAGAAAALTGAVAGAETVGRLAGRSGGLLGGGIGVLGSGSAGGRPAQVTAHPAMAPGFAEAMGGEAIAGRRAIDVLGTVGSRVAGAVGGMMGAVTLGTMGMALGAGAGNPRDMAFGAALGARAGGSVGGMVGQTAGQTLGRRAAAHATILANRWRDQAQDRLAVTPASAPTSDAPPAEAGAGLQDALASLGYTVPPPVHAAAGGDDEPGAPTLSTDGGQPPDGWTTPDDVAYHRAVRDAATYGYAVGGEAGAAAAVAQVAYPHGGWTSEAESQVVTRLGSGEPLREVLRADGKGLFLGDQLIAKSPLLPTDPQVAPGQQITRTFTYVASPDTIPKHLQNAERYPIGSGYLVRDDGVRSGHAHQGAVGPVSEGVRHPDPTLPSYFSTFSWRV